MCGLSTLLEVVKIYKWPPSLNKWTNEWMGSGFKEKVMAELSPEGQYLGKERK